MPVQAPPNGRRRAARTSTPARRTYGTVRERASGRFQALYTGPDGERRTAGTYDTRKAAEGALAAVLADVYRGTYRAPETGSVPLADYARRWLARRAAGVRPLRPSTLTLYGRLLERWILAELPVPGSRRTLELGTYPLRSLSPSAVAEWHAAVLGAARASAAAHATRGPEPADAAQARAWAAGVGMTVGDSGRLPRLVWDAWASAGRPRPLAAPVSSAAGDGSTQAAHAYALLRTICADAVHERLIEYNPCQVRGAGQVRPAPRRLPTTGEVDAVAAAMPARYRAAVVVAAWSALRAGELFALERRHVELTRDAAGTVTGAALRVERALVDISGQPAAYGPPKSDAGRRTVHLPPTAARALAEHLETHTAVDPLALVFATSNGRPVRRGHRTQMFSRAKKRAGVDPSVHWHDLRHAGATKAAQAGATLAELQRRMGHSTVRAAMIYQHATDDGDRRLAERLAALEAPDNVRHLAVVGGGR